MKDIAIYVFITAFLTALIYLHEERFHFGLGSLVFNTVCIILFVTYIIKRDMPLSHLPVIGKYFKK